MIQTSVNNKRLAKNTLLLYFRMLITILVGLYTSRVVLNTLGISDYGVYNVVGGAVAMLAFLNGALTAASQRFISYELGKGDIRKLKIVFCTSVTIHIVLALIILLVAETVGLWFVNTHLNIEPGRMAAANWVYQCSIVTMMLTVLSVPYNACIVAHEHMKAFAYVSILEVTLKLAIVYVLLVIKFDKLIVYALLVMCVSLVVRGVYGIYCKRHFEECTYRVVFDKSLFKEMFAFAGWSIVGNLGFSFKDQLSNIILNLFFGTVVNAARGVALQVNGIISSFSYNFLMALNPQITKHYAAGDVAESVKLVLAGCRYSFFLLLLIATPVMVNIDYILELWLGIVPQYTAEFLRLALVVALVNAMAMPLVTALQATGKIKVFQLAICVIMLCELPLVCIVLYFGGKPYTAMYPTLLVTLVGLFARFVILQKQVPAYRLGHFALYVVLRNVAIASVCIAASAYIHGLLGNGWWAFVVTTILSCGIVAIGVYAFGIEKTERRMINSGIRSRLGKWIVV